MTKQALIASLQALDHVEMLLDLTIVSGALPADADLYRQGAIIVDPANSIAQETAFYFYVLYEGTENEVAYHREAPPTNPFKTAHWLADKYKSQIDERNGVIVESGDNWIVVTGYEEDVATGEMIKKTWFVKEVDGIPTIKLVK